MELPDGWKWTTLEDFCDIITDYVANGSFASLKANVHYNYEEDYAILIRTIDNSNEFRGPFVYIDKKSYEFLSKSKVRLGDIILSNVGSIGSVFQAPDLGKPMSIAPNAILLRTKKSNDYLYYWFKTKTAQQLILKLSSKTTQLKFNKTRLRKLIIPNPPIEIQQKIVSIMKKAESIKQLREESDKWANGLLQSIFLDMFGDPVTNPKGWEFRMLGDVVVNSLNGFGRRTKKELEKNPIVLRIRDINNGYIDLSAPRRIGMTLEEFEKYQLKSNDFIYVRVNGAIELVGKCAVINSTQEELTFSDHLVRLRFDLTQINPIYIKFLTQTSYFKSKLFKKIVTTAGQNSIGFGRLSQITIPVPPISHQNNFASFVEKTEQMKSEQVISKEQIDNLFSALMQKAFKGELVN